jgi:cation-transporting ATPase 13A2
MVKSTGFLTQKGSLVRDILYPKPFIFQFQRDVYKFIFLLAGFAFIGFFAVIPGLRRAGLHGVELANKLIDLITIAVPPSLPAAMNFGVIFSLSRLKKEKIFCISPPRIPLSARIQTYVFDKTGTLTEEGLSVLGPRPTNNGEVREFSTKSDVHPQGNYAL